MRQSRFLIPGVGPDTPVSEAATATLLTKSKRMFELETAASGGADMEAVHDMRVASRRTREALNALAPAFKPKALDELTSISKTVTRSLGAVRDADVFIAEFTEMAAQAEDPDERIALAYLIGQRQGERVAALGRMRKRLGSLELKQSRKRFRKVAANTRKSSTRQPLVSLAHDVLNERIDLVYAHLPAALEQHDAPEQHAMRISFKQLRYAVETFAPCFDSSFSRIHGTLVAFQDVLGEIHDLDVFSATVETALQQEDSVQAGVTSEGAQRVLADLATQRYNRYRRFRRLMLRYPEDRTRERILGALIEGADDALQASEAGGASRSTASSHRAIPLGTGTSLAVTPSSTSQPANEPQPDSNGDLPA